MDEGAREAFKRLLIMLEFGDAEFRIAAPLFPQFVKDFETLKKYFGVKLCGEEKTILSFTSGNLPES